MSDIFVCLFASDLGFDFLFESRQGFYANALHNGCLALVQGDSRNTHDLENSCQAWLFVHIDLANLDPAGQFIGESVDGRGQGPAG
jgi:hypothetical protein